MIQFTSAWYMMLQFQCGMYSVSFRLQDGAIPNDALAYAESVLNTTIMIYTNSSNSLNGMAATHHL